jgi:hypothetical protein
MVVGKIRGAINHGDLLDYQFRPDRFDFANSGFASGVKTFP